MGPFPQQYYGGIKLSACVILSSHCFSKNTFHTHTLYLLIFHAHLCVLQNKNKSALYKEVVAGWGGIALIGVRCALYKLPIERIITSPALGSAETPEALMDAALMETKRRLNTNKP